METRGIKLEYIARSLTLYEKWYLPLDGDHDKVDHDRRLCAYEKEDLVVTAEKGPVACRDFPHS